MRLTSPPVCANNQYLEKWYRDAIMGKITLAAKAHCDQIYYRMLVGDPVTVQLSQLLDKWIVTYQDHVIYIDENDPSNMLDKIGFYVTRV